MLSNDTAPLRVAYVEGSCWVGRLVAGDVAITRLTLFCRATKQHHITLQANMRSGHDMLQLLQTRLVVAS